VNFKQNALQLVVATTLAVAGSAASATVVNFDDLTGGGTLANGYGGIDWNNNWLYYDSPQTPYNPSSLSERVYTNYALHPSGNTEAVSFSFASGVVFNGADFAGTSGNGDVEFQLYYLGTLVHTSASLDQSATPTFLSSGYAGLVDTVAILGRNGYYVFDDVTYSATSTVPEASNVAMMLGGLLLTAGLLRRARKS
jgi:hypothetical protein